LERQLQRAARRPNGPARLVHVGPRQEQRDARPAGTRAADRELAAVLVLGARKVPARCEQVGHLEADVVTCAGVAGARVAEPYDQPVGVIAAEEAQDSSPEAS